MKILDRVLSCLLILGGVGHTAGTFVGYWNKPDLFLWSLCASGFIFLLGFVNLLRAGRRGDRALGWLTLIFNLGWLTASIAFGKLIHNMYDFRVLGFGVIMLGLCGMSIGSILAPRHEKQ
jgi:hypothetical protein